MELRNPLALLAFLLLNAVVVAADTNASDAQSLANILAPLNKVKNLVLSVAGVIAVIFLVINGVKWMFADSPQAKEEAKRGLQGAIIGLVIIAAAFPLTDYLLP
ncbi:MAG: TrbC/VirB2 family protein [Candidatus Diapherotrites archaeon]|uniref:TrbC/VirB2 family protein n=1 Tax=Candidatus Iainarchaeum sp. TaxID=3101447 RepID=A0A8T4LBX7_9ARCH|nr:TrbC/VirB2 family protein [Candidatus Diapherotrites archaeon]